MPAKIDDKVSDEKVGLWDSLLRDVQQSTSVPDSTLLMFGREGCGKRELVQALLSHACPAAAAADAAETAEAGYEFHGAVGLKYFGVRDPDENEAASNSDFQCPAACSVLMLEEEKHENLLRSRLTPERIRNCAAVICLNLKEPWTMMEDLQKWVAVLQKMMSELMQQLPLDEQDELRAKVADAVSNFKEYKESAQPAAQGEGEQSDPPPQDAQENQEEGGGATLTYNLGIPLIIAVTRADGAAALDSQKTTGWAETIESHLRNECLSYGATIVYTMVHTKNSRNIDVLYDYLMHRLYNYNFKHSATVPSRDGLFCPSGWDNQEKVDILVSTLPGGGLQRSFESVVVSPTPPPAAPPPPEEAEDMSTFLRRASQNLQKLGGVSVATRRPRVSDAGATAPVVPRASIASPTARRPTSVGEDSVRPDTEDAGAPKTSPAAASIPKVGAVAGGVAPSADNKAMANFFQNLLTRGQAGAAGSSPSAAKAKPAAPASPEAA